MTPTRLHSKLLSIVRETGTSFSEWVIGATTINRVYSNLYKVDELTFPLEDETECVKQVMAWGKSPQGCTDTISEYVNEEENSYLLVAFARDYEYELNVADVLKKKVASPFEEPLTVATKKDWDLSAEKSEVFEIAEVLGNNTAREYAEAVEVKGIRINEVGGNKFETIATNDNVQMNWRAVKEYSEPLAINESAINGITTYKAEEVNVRGKRMTATTNGVLSNVSFSEGAELYEDFQKTADKVAGYTSFIEFKVGDYEYQDAIYRMSITRTNLNSNALIYDYAVHVDIPDTFDRGEAAVSGETNIYFNKHYYHAPEVNVTVTGGTEILIPRIITLNGSDGNGRYFTVILENTSGVSKAGRISWSARGY